MTVPGVGSIAALTFRAAVDDPVRFKRSRTVAAHFGLTPRRYQSGEQDTPGRISKAGDRDVKVDTLSRRQRIAHADDGGLSDQVMLCPKGDCVAICR
ncbi:MAG: IS110 family transposase [Pseudomonadota bacterium]